MSLIFMPLVVGAMASESVAAHDPYWSSVVLLAHFDNNFTDSSSFAHGITQFGSGHALTTTSAQSQFGGFSANSANNLCGATWNSSADFGLGTGDATIECSLYFTTISVAQEFIDFRTSANQSRPTLYFNSADNTFRYFSSNADRIISAAGIMSTGGWHRIAWSRIGGTSRLFFDGAQTGSDFSDTQNCATTAITIMNSFNAASVGVANGYMDELRVTKGVGRYGPAGYTPQPFPFPNA